MPNVRSALRYVSILAAISFGVIAAAILIAKTRPEAAVGVYAYALIPVIAAILSMRLAGERLAKAALKIGKAKDLALAWTIGIGAALLAHFGPIFFGLGAFDPGYAKFTGLLEQLGQPPPQAPAEFFAFFSIMTLTFFLLPGVLFAFAEEFGFRGYLLPNLWAAGKLKALFLAGLIWGIWKAPVMLFSEAPTMINLFYLLATATLFGFILGWLYLRTKNIWVPSLASAAWQNSQVIYSLAAGTPPWIIEISSIIALASICAILYFSGEFEKISP